MLDDLGYGFIGGTVMDLPGWTGCLLARLKLGERRLKSG